MTTTELGLFLAATFVIMAVPGPTVVFVVARTLEGGRAAGVVTMLGLESGLVLHLLIASTGLAAAVATSDLALAGLRYGGAAYLLVLGVRHLGSRHPDRAAVGEPARATRTRRRLFAEAFVVDALNPKTVLFFVAFLPQFLAPGHGSSTTHLAFLGLGIVAVAVVCDGCYLLVASLLTGRGDAVIGASPLWWLVGVLYLGLAALAAAG